jgi:hypothetical protein
VVPCSGHSPSRASSTTTQCGSPPRTSGIGSENGVAEVYQTLRWRCRLWRQEVGWRPTPTVKFQQLQLPNVHGR